MTTGKKLVKSRLLTINFFENKCAVDFIIFGTGIQPWHILKEDVYLIYDSSKMDMLKCVEKIQKSVNYIPESNRSTLNEITEYCAFMVEIVKKETLSEITKSPQRFKKLLSEYGTGNAKKDKIIFEKAFKKKCLDNLLIEPVKKDMNLTNLDFTNMQFELLEYTRKRNTLVEFSQKINGLKG